MLVVKVYRTSGVLCSNEATAQNDARLQIPPAWLSDYKLKLICIVAYLHARPPVFAHGVLG